jgi:ABC-type multidrug transport system fused ATPase/permease subunit
MLVIAHRVTTIMDADEVCVFSGGKIVEQGLFSDLSLDKNSRLAQMISNITLI